jgi:hypothetical protein
MTTLHASTTEVTYKFASRGPGQSWDSCFVCHELPLMDGLGDGSAHDNLAAFVQSREDGEAIIRLFAELGCEAHRDYRPSEPHWIQVKIGACPTHRPSLRLLDHMTRINDEINLQTIAYCLPRPRAERDHR